jgi:hypothetical protein
MDSMVDSQKGFFSSPSIYFRESTFEYLSYENPDSFREDEDAGVRI